MPDIVKSAARPVSAKPGGSGKNVVPLTGRPQPGGADPSLPMLQPPTMGAKVSREEKHKRLFFLAKKIMDGVPYAELIDVAMHFFGVARRTAQKYVKRAKERIMRAALEEDPQFYLHLSRAQRDNMIWGLQMHMARPEQLKPEQYARLAGTLNKLLDSRDRTAAELLDMREEHVQHVQSETEVRFEFHGSHPDRPPRPLAPDSRPALENDHKLLPSNKLKPVSKGK